jgi:acyl-CoA synthetase (AMP-forming)/AMP-acid ligase II
MIGAIMVPVNTRFRGAEAGYILERTRAKILCSTQPFLGTDYVKMLQQACGGAGTACPIAGLPALTHILQFDGNAESCAATSWQNFLQTQAPEAMLAACSAKVTPTDTADILFTSGTTGNPKGAMHSHGQSIWMVSLWNQANDLRPGDKELIINPFFHSFGYRAGWLSCLLGGLSVYPLAVFDAAKLMQTVAREKITVLMGPPAIFSSVLEHKDRPQYNLSSLRVGHTGASNMPVELIRAAREELQFDLFLTSFGLTESTALVSVCRPSDSAEVIAKTLGKPLPGTQLRFIDAGGQTVAPGASGELLVRGPNVMQGYFEDPEATAKTVDADGWLHTGDIGCIGEDGNLRIFDRIKDVVIVGGFNVYPAEVENILRQHPAIAEAAVISVPDARMGEVAGVCVVLAPGQQLTLDELTAWTRERLANFKVPRHLFILDQIPKTALGKPQKFLLRKQVLA